jgi:hypothetical protein
VALILALLFVKHRAERDSWSSSTVAYVAAFLPIACFAFVPDVIDLVARNTAGLEMVVPWVSTLALDVSVAIFVALASIRFVWRRLRLSR